MPDWLNYTGVISSVASLIVACATLWVARKAREAAQEARDAVRAEALADEVADMGQWGLLLVEAARGESVVLFSSVGAQLWARAAALLDRRELLSYERRSDLSHASRRLRRCLTEIAATEVAGEVARRPQAMHGAALDIVAALTDTAASVRRTASRRDQGE